MPVLFPRRPDVLFVSCEMREEILRQYGNMTAYIARFHGRELRRENLLPGGVYELELGPAVPVLAPRIRRFG